MAMFWAKREGMLLRPDGAESVAALSKLPLGKPIQVTVKQSRNPRQHKLYWTLCKRIGDAVGCEDEDISHLLKVRTGHVRHLKTKRGTEEVPKSISFASMDQTEFDAFFTKCVYVIYNEFGIAQSDILECVKDLLDQKVAA